MENKTIKKSNFLTKLETGLVILILIFVGWFAYSSIYGLSLKSTADKQSLITNLRGLITKSDSQEVSENDKKTLESITSPGNFITSWQDNSYLSLFRKLNVSKPLGEITETNSSENASVLNLQFCAPEDTNNCSKFMIYIEKASRSKFFVNYSAWQIYDLKVDRVDNCLELYFDLLQATGCIQAVLKSWLLNPQLSESIYQTLLSLLSQIANPTDKILSSLTSTFIAVLTQFPKEIIAQKIAEISKILIQNSISPNLTQNFIQGLENAFK